MTQSNKTQIAEELLKETDSGGRSPHGLSAKVLWIVPLFWALFQLWIASPVGYSIGFFSFNESQARAIHLAFALFLAFTAYPALHRSPRHYIPWSDWLFAILGSFAALYLVLFNDALSARSGAPTIVDVTVALIGMILLLEATRRALGPPLMVVALVFLIYAFAGPYMPAVIAHKGVSLHKAMSHLWLSSEGVFGVALGVSTSFVFLFVLFGALLERAGAGAYFIKVAFAYLGHMRGGPAKAAVVASALSGLVSGSSIANVVTTGTFTIPLMKRVGFSSTKAAAIEVAASTNGQITPPIMGAAAFLMVEYIGIPYIEVVKAAMLPALISYIALLYIVHLEACKAGMKGLPKRHNKTILQSIIGFLTFAIALGLFSLAVYYGVGWVKGILGDASAPILGILLIFIYIALVRYSSQYQDENMDNIDLEELPDASTTVKAGLYFLVPIFVLVWCLTVERFSPGLSAFWASLFMSFIVITQRPLIAYFKKEKQLKTAFKRGAHELLDSLITGSRNMIGIGIATSAAGIIVGVVTLTGIGQVMTDLIAVLSGGNLFLILIFTAMISLILGMGLPTTANYIVVSTLMAPVVVTLGAQNGLIIPLVAVHLFVFYFGILADVTPPVGLAAFAAAAIAKSDPIKTGIQGFIYSARTTILPFMFIFNTQLLLIGIDTWWHLAITIISAILAMLTFSAATQHFILIKNRWWETLLLLLITFTLFRPGFWWDQIYPATKKVESSQIIDIAQRLRGDQSLSLHVKGNDIMGDPVDKQIQLPIDTNLATGQQRIEKTGMTISIEKNDVLIDTVTFGSSAQKAGLDFGLKITNIIAPNERPMKEWVFLPTLFVLLLLVWNHRRRAIKEAKNVQTYYGPSRS